MKKLVILLFFIIISIQTIQIAAASEKLPVKITPTEVISTHHDEVEVGDYIKFKTLNDVCYQEKLYIKKDSTIIGIVSNVHENGYFFDNAEIILTPFKVRTTDNKLITINTTLTLNRKDFICKNLGDKIVKYIGVVFRGNELKIEPNTVSYNLFLMK